MSAWVRLGRYIGALGLVASGAAAGLYMEGRLLGTVGLLVGGCLAFGALFLTSPTCDRCGSMRINHINDAPPKCGRCGHVHGGSTESVVLTDPIAEPPRPIQRPDGRRWLSTLRAFSLGIFVLGVAVVVYSVMGLTVPDPLDPQTWNAENTWRLFVAIFGLALNTLGLMIYIISYKLS
jgi:ribosomal protein S27AE